jgi:ADP-heptose:LPS heptosyltransferase
MNDRIVVFRPGALGDTVVAADALVALKARYPGSTLELVGNYAVAALLRAAGIVDLATSFDALAVTDLFSRPPVVAPSWRELLVAVLWLNDGSQLAEALEKSGAGAVICRPSAPAVAIHISDYLVDTLAPLGLRRPDTGPTLLTLPTEQRSAEDDRLRVLIHPGSGGPRKNWPAECFAELISALGQVGWSTALLEGPADAKAIGSTNRLLGDAPETVRPLGVGDLAAALAGARLFIGNDSGVSHLAARLGVATVAIFGETDPRRWAPRGPRVAIVGDQGRWPTVQEVTENVERLIDHDNAATSQGAGMDVR